MSASKMSPSSKMESLLSFIPLAPVLIRKKIKKRKEVHVDFLVLLHGIIAKI
jgi:hypothetical protein